MSIAPYMMEKSVKLDYPPINFIAFALLLGILNG